MAEGEGVTGVQAAQAVAEKIVELLPQVDNLSGAQMIRDLADAYARLYRPNAQGITVNVDK